MQRRFKLLREILDLVADHDAELQAMQLDVDEFRVAERVAERQAMQPRRFHGLVRKTPWSRTMMQSYKRCNWM